MKLKFVHHLPVSYFVSDWQAGFFKRNFQKKEEEEFNRDSWDYVPKPKKRESNA